MRIGNSDPAAYISIESAEISEREKLTKGGIRVEITGNFIAESRTFAGETSSKAVIYLTRQQCKDLIKTIRILA